LRFATGMTPIISALPRSLSNDNKLKTEATLTGNYVNDSNVGMELKTSNDIQEQLLTNVLKELKKMNFQLSLMTDTTI